MECPPAPDLQPRTRCQVEALGAEWSHPGFCGLNVPWAAVEHGDKAPDPPMLGTPCPFWKGMESRTLGMWWGTTGCYVSAFPESHAFTF